MGAREKALPAKTDFRIASGEPGRKTGRLGFTGARFLAKGSAFHANKESTLNRFQVRARVWRKSLGPVLLLPLWTACGSTPVQECLDLSRRGDFQRAVFSCRQAHEETGDALAALTAAKALFRLGRTAESRAQLEPLLDSVEGAAAWTLAGEVLEAESRFEEAFQAYRKGVELFREAANPLQASRTAYLGFYAAWKRSDYPTALEFAETAVAEAKLSGDAMETATALEGLFSVLYDVGDLAAAERALDQAEALTLNQDAEQRVRFLTNRSSLRMDQGRYELARICSLQALEAAERTGDPLHFRSNHLNLVRASLALSDVESARRHWEAARRHADGESGVSLPYYEARVLAAEGRHAEAAAALRGLSGQADDWAWRVEWLRGRVAERVGDLEEAERAYRAAASVVERMRGSFLSDGLKTWLLDRKRRPLEGLFRVLEARGRREESLAAVERAKARTFLDQFVAASLEMTEQVPSSSPARLRTLESLLPRLAASPTVGAVDVGQILRKLRRRPALVYFEADEELWLLAWDGRLLRTRALGLDRSSLERQVRAWLARPDDAAIRLELSERLLPRDLLPPAGGRLLIVPDRVLGRLPFCALRIGDRFLVEEWTLAVVPSLSALAAIEQGPVRWTSDAAVLGDPAGDLPGARREATEVARLLGVEARLGAGASAAALADLAAPRTLHLATHSGLGPGGGWLQLSDSQVGVDGLLSRGWRPGLVVLASCASGAPRGPGLWGSLGAGFLAAGSKAVVASLWSVEDESARAFLVEFYRRGGAKDPAEALAQTQRAWIAAGRPVQAWAPFVLFGTDRPIPSGRSGS